MSILTLQRRLRELGRIRTGVKVAASNGKSRPAKLETFRLTSASRGLLDAAAEIYGGDVRAWPEGDGWELVTKVDALDIVSGLAAIRLAPPELARRYWHFLTGLWIYLMLLFTLWANR